MSLKITHREQQQPADYKYSSYRLNNVICFVTELLNAYIIMNNKFSQIYKHISR